MERRTPLYSEHLALKAQMVPFAGWLMPLHYGSQLKEHEAVREHVGMFDVSHMAIFDVKGPQAETYLRTLLANDVAKLKEPNRALYSCLLNDSAGILDDLIVYKLADDSFRVVVNASTREKDLQWFQQHAASLDVSIEWLDHLGLLAIQGPDARNIVKGLFPDNATALVNLKSFSFLTTSGLTLACTGYTGEDGFEIMGEPDKLKALWQACLAQGVQPCGLGARDSLRLEAGLNLYGTDMDESTTPLESNLSWTVDLKDESRSFIGQEAYLAQKQKGASRKLVGLTLETGGVLRHGMIVRLDGKDDLKGEITSGSYSPRLKHSIALARIPNHETENIEVEIRGQWKPVARVKLPFIKKS